MQWGIVDVDRWIKSLPKGVFDKWMAFDAIEPIGEQWRQTAQITTMIERLIEFTSSIHYGSGNFTPTTIDDNMPSRYIRRKKPKQQAVQQDDTKPKHENAQFHQLAAAFGLSQVVLENGRID